MPRGERQFRKNPISVQRCGTPRNVRVARFVATFKQSGSTLESAVPSGKR